MSTEKCMAFCKRHENTSATKANLAVISTEFCQMLVDDQVLVIEQDMLFFCTRLPKRIAA
jgi:hypothetical protein